MSKEKSPRSPSQVRDVYVKYKTIANNSKHRSGILERYTYKTDAGQLLSSASSDKTSQKHISSVPYPSISISRERLEDSNGSSVLEIKKRKTNTEPNVSIYKVGNSNNKDKSTVRTETCDSTTDIVEYLDTKHIDLLRALADNRYQGDDSQYCSRYSGTASVPTVLGTAATTDHTIHIDSDSDCEIVEVEEYIDNISDTSVQTTDTVPCTPKQVNDSPMSPRSKDAVNWVSKPDPVILVISDSDDEESSKQKLKDTKHNAAILDKEFTFLCEKTGLRKVMPQSGGFGGSVTICTDEIKNVSILEGKSTYLKKIGPNSVTYSKILTVQPSIEKCADDKESVEMINEKYSVVKNKLSPLKAGSPVKTLPITSKPPEYLLNSPKRELSPLLSDMSPQKTQELLSPETMKSEFYKYLKINTNPLAQKTAAVTQNRRSNRVKNLILQIEKAKELDTIRNEYDKPSTSRQSTEKDIRKKYMKYTKPKLVFPVPLLEHNKPMNFDESFINYAKQEGIDIGKLATQHTKYVKLGVERKRKQTVSEHGQMTKVREQNGIMMKKKLMKTGQKKQVTRKILNVKNLTHFPEKSRRKRLGTNRILRNTSSRATRADVNSFKPVNSKLMKGRRIKLQVVLNKSIHDEAINKLDPEVILAEQSTLTEDSKTPNDQLEPVIECKPDLFKQEDSIPIASESDILLPNILAKKLSEALHKHKHDESRMSKSTTKPTAISVATSNMTFPVFLPSVCKTEYLAESYSTDTEEKKTFYNMNDDVIQKVPETVQLSINHTGSDSTNHIKELESPSDSNEILTAQVKIDTEPVNTGNMCQANSSTSAFLGFASTDQSLCNPLVYSNSSEQYSCLGFSVDADTLRINKVMQEIIAALSKMESVEPRKECEKKKRARKVVPNIVITESSDVENSSETPATIDENYSSSEYSSVHDDESVASASNVIQSVTIQSGNPDYIPLNRDMKIKSLHSSLLHASSKCKSSVVKSGMFELSDSDSSMSSPKTPKGSLIKKPTTHEIDINRNDGAVFNAYYVDDILIIVQNMWLPRGNLQRIILDPGCVNRRSSEMIMSVDNAIAYIELWTKEHKCYYRECPIADVFATIYFQRGNGAPDKKVIQLENIKGYGDDVRFAVVKTSREIIVSWCDTYSKPIKSVIRSYQLAPDFQTVASVKEMESVPHYVSSIHNIHDCDNLVLGAGNDQISLWNLKHGYLVMTLNMADGPIQPLVRSNTICLFAQCNTAFLFLIQQTEVGVLRLVAVNGITHEWKQLHSYQVPETYNKLLGVIVESGVLMTCYTNGFLSWNMHTGEILSEIDTGNEHIVLPSNKYLVAIDNYQVNVQHIMAYILTHDW